MPSITCDFLVVGAGIIGLTVAHELLLLHPRKTIVIIEKEECAGKHASGRNSGVMHSGIYYANDTIKAKVCSEGRKRIIEFAKEENINFAESGKVIIATEDDEMETIEKLLKNAKANDIFAKQIDNAELKRIEPHAADAISAIWTPSTAIIDSSAVIIKLVNKLKRHGIKFMFNTCVISVDNNAVITNSGKIYYGFLFNCAGAYADKVAKKFGKASDYTLVPFKGIYWKLSERANRLVRSNIYPVPDITLPFLGVHLTRVISGEVYVGPTAIPVLGRENYYGFSGVNIKESAEIGYSLIAMYLKNKNNFRKLSHHEIFNYIKRNFLSRARKLVPDLSAKDLIITNKSGIRPQLINKNTYQLEMDYILEKTDKTIHVLNSISPAFTSSFEFAKVIVRRSNVL